MKLDIKVVAILSVALAFASTVDACGFGSAGRRQLLQATTADSGNCSRSWLGYQCTKLVCGRIRIHWSLGGPPPPGPGCSYAADWSTSGLPDASSPLLHMALQTDVGGYVAVSWPRTPGVMAPADAVIGFATGDGGANIQAYSISGWTPATVQPDSLVSVTSAALEANASSLTICFTRNISQVGKAAGIAIDPASPHYMNFVASSAAFNARHLLRQDYKCTARVALAAPPGGADDGGWRPTNTSADAEEADEEEAIQAERLTYMRLHGALQFTGWMVLVPAGTLAARHRWAFAPLALTGLWFQVHRAVQMLATVLIVTGFVLPWASFDSTDAEAAQGTGHDDSIEDDPLLENHERLAITLITGLGLHVVLAVLRPGPDAPRRRIWNLVHWWTGRGLVLLAGVNICLGISLWRRVSGGSGSEWVVTLILFAVLWLGLAAWLEWRAPPGLGRETAPPPVDNGIAAGLTAGFASSSNPSTAGNEVNMTRLAAGSFAPTVGYSKLAEPAPAPSHAHRS
ncbi:hypothetical protein CHLRE_16g672850v5 [Chlamydomonas reinhardtii]|uniref:Uncharacterized protein n=1 Tax=Chlamydomonas reinhardtii TaxID=3055 RepID=A8J3G1_CHLRE|nr:uncharacterized protein CHLRE_16g672850v5 [Chlamydomonas reinhardtii]PNW72324.1 hypothetical protein CHLRE_16g672850v5 [Chlamydomonas reinhardtii]|eukprot:XP_001695917.1 transmembrane protein [Chlamydomonas reinhardtii]